VASTTGRQRALSAAMKAAMKDKDKDRLSTLRLILAEFKRIEVDERIEVDDARALMVLDKMVKQRRDSIATYEQGNRKDLADKEAAEIIVIEEFLPKMMDEAATRAAIAALIAEVGADLLAELRDARGDLGFGDERTERRHFTPSCC
jgi:uncharacterized protein YqeY